MYEFGDMWPLQFWTGFVVKLRQTGNAGATIQNNNCPKAVGQEKNQRTIRQSTQMIEHVANKAR